MFRPLAALALIFATATPALPEGAAGAYLAARNASMHYDYRAAADYYAKAIAADPSNLQLLESAVVAYHGLGRTDRAAAVARRLIGVGGNSQVANLVLLTDGMQRENYEGVLKDLDAGLTVGPLVDGLVRAWALVGLGRMSDALEAFDKVAETPGVELFGYYHKALSLAMVGDYEGAEAIFSGQAHGSLQLTRRGIIAFAQVLSQLERNDDAVELIDAAYGEKPDPELTSIRERLQAGETLPFDVLRNARDGAAEVFLVVAGALNGEANDGYTLLYARAAEYLRPDHVDAILLTAGLLESLGRYDLATEEYDKIPPDHPAYLAAELGRIEALRQSGRNEAAIEALRQLAKSQPDNAEIQMMLGDALRREERYDEASRAYDAAIALFDKPERQQWLAYFARGITHEREKRWDKAEADFRKALELNPGQPQVLNYLGYSFVEMGTNLDEALEMIKQAVAAEPDSGYIVDSLGWLQFRLGQYEEAVTNLERAAELMPVDPVVNDHLGDAYWAVGRKTEARFQWRRALSFDPEEKDAKRIRRKLEVGLDKVLTEEGAEPLKTELLKTVASDG